MNGRMKVIDLNAELGESGTQAGLEQEVRILDFVSSANIACGGHAGDVDSMRMMVKACKSKGVAIGAHPAYPDRENFGRMSKVLGQDISVDELRVSITRQIHDLINIARDEDAEVRYMKPHGALYNDAVGNRDLSDVLVTTVKAINPELIFMGAPKSHMKWAAKRYGVRYVSEGFIDRRYTDDGHLLSRAKPGAVLTTQDERMGQLASLLGGRVTTDSGNSLELNVATLCLHGDSDGATDTADLARQTIEDAGFAVRSFIHA